MLVDWDFNRGGEIVREKKRKKTYSEDGGDTRAAGKRTAGDTTRTLGGLEGESGT